MWLLFFTLHFPYSCQFDVAFACTLLWLIKYNLTLKRYFFPPSGTQTTKCYVFVICTASEQVPDALECILLV